MKRRSKEKKSFYVNEGILIDAFTKESKLS